MGSEMCIEKGLPGYLIANQAADTYYIVSKDKGFEILSGYWKNRGVSVTLIADITGRSHP